MKYAPTIINMLVIFVLAAEIAGIGLGVISPSQLLIVSFVSGLLTLTSFRLSKIALQRINEQENSEEAKAQASTQTR